MGADPAAPRENRGGQRAGDVKPPAEPFVVLCQPGTDENHGLCYGMSFVYSGNFSMTAELDQFSHVRAAMGIAPQGFSWRLAPEESFQTPEVVLCCAQGLCRPFQELQPALPGAPVPGAWRNQPRPVLINSWEAAYFDFDDEKLVRIAAEAQKARHRPAGHG